MTDTDLIDDHPQYTIIGREVGSRFTVVYSRHETRDEAEHRKDELAWDFNQNKMTWHLTVVEL